MGQPGDNGAYSREAWSRSRQWSSCGPAEAAGHQIGNGLIGAVVPRTFTQLLILGDGETLAEPAI